MSTGNSSLIAADFGQGIDHLGLFPKKSLIFGAKVSAAKKTSTLMWRNSAKQAFCRACACRLDPRPSSRAFPCCGFLGKVTEPGFAKDVKFRPLELAFGAIRSPREEDGSLRNRIGFVSPFCSKGYASVAEQVSSSTDIEDDVSVGEEFLQEVGKEEGKREAGFGGRRRQRVVGGMTKNKYDVLRKRQVKIETEAWQNAVEEYRALLREMCKQKLAPNLPYMKSLLLGWFEPLRDAIEKEQELCRKQKNMALAPFLRQLPAEMMAVITMHKLMGLLMSKEEHGTARIVPAALMIGDAIEQEAKIQRFLEASKKKKIGYNEENEVGPDARLEDKLKKKVTNLMKQQKLRAVRQIVNTHDSLKPWGQTVKAKVGSRLIELLIQTAYIQSPPAHQLAHDPPDVRPAFVHTIRNSTKNAKQIAKRFGIIQCDPLVVKGLERTATHVVIPYMPMLVPPVNWTGYDKGGHFFLPSYVMRTHGVRHQREAVKKAPRSQLEPVFEALDSLGNTRWRVNKRVLTVVERIWSSGGCLADLVDRNDVPLPEKPDTEDETLLKKWKREVRSIRKENRERYSQRCDIELKLAVARKMKDEEGFYYPHNVDFRGRGYPMHSYLNHLGSDLCRGILEFAEGRPLGNSGLRWLKIHLANVYAGGVDKLSHESRVAFIENHLDEIFDAADRPLDGKRWWLNAEDPFQCLAACIDLTDALRSSSPETFISHIHVHQDGSCNGLQHYAALGRDKLGAAAVNLVAGDKPADVYSGIAGRVLEIMRRDAEEDPEVYPDALQAKLLVNQVDRKLVKQTVMTSVYGVTFIGARDQIRKRLKERDANLDEQELFKCSCYAAKITLTALGEMFEAARCIMSWLGECAKVIASANEPVKWTTPLGLPVVQPYRKLGKHFIKTSLQVLTVQRETEKILVRKQRTAFPPNFVHSLDGSHMMMTAVACRKAGITFAGVHDSYWTHACDVDEMNKILREKFVELYKTPILENLLESFQQSFPELTFPPLPERGNFDLTNVLESPYFFN